MLMLVMHTESGSLLSPSWYLLIGSFRHSKEDGLSGFQKRTGLSYFQNETGAETQGHGVCCAGEIAGMQQQYARQKPDIHWVWPMTRLQADQRWAGGVCGAAVLYAMAEGMWHL